MNNLEKASIEAWNHRLYEEITKPRLAKQNRDARKARKQARYRRELLASLHATASRAFIPKIIKRPSDASRLNASSPASIEHAK